MSLPFSFKNFSPRSGAASEVKGELEVTQQAVTQLAAKEAELQFRLARLNVVRLIEETDVTRNTPSWVVIDGALQARP